VGISDIGDWFGRGHHADENVFVKILIGKYQQMADS
jgi:hypothetical protein